MECPECNKVLYERARSCSCGWGKKKESAGKDVDWWRCTDVQFGQRCSKPGALSDSTFGTGPWYCAQHYPGFKRAGKAATRDAPVGIFDRLRATLQMREPGQEG